LLTSFLPHLSLSGVAAPPLVWSLPFVLLLLGIAAFPLFAPQWWIKRYPWFSLALGAVVVGYYLFFRQDAARMLHSGTEYFSFIALIGSLFVVAGGMHLGLRGSFTPNQNIVLLAVGSVLANFVGTTGAAMILIRPYIRGNAWRWSSYHVVFFIFIIANCGGALTPIGDPPLFLGYLRGVPFFWVVAHLWYKWAVAVALLLAMFYLVDRRAYQMHPRRERLEAEEPDRLRFEGMHNLIFIGMIIAAAFVQRPPFLREAIMMAAAAGSYLTTPKRLHRLNEFHWHPIQEVAILFAGIFATMVPTLDWLSVNASQIGIATSTGYYWATGSLSSVLDNAPTYLTFLAAAMGLNGLSVQTRADVLTFAMQHPDLLRAISIAAVFFGAGTYIGNGPNFMCKAIVDHARLRTPSFIEYVYKYSIPILLPVLIVTYFWVR
jgi:Na+/H+ antiporter NhaD/arsenite permease-like protein